MFPLADVQDWAYTPIKAICSLLPSVVNDRWIAWLGCNKKHDTADPQTLAQVQKDVKELKDQLPAKTVDMQVFAQMRRDLDELKVRMPANAALDAAAPSIVLPPGVEAPAKPAGAEPDTGKKGKGSKPEQPT
jgi:hypothetical protein